MRGKALAKAGSIALVLVVVLVVGVLREGARLEGLEALVAARGLSLRSPFVAGERPPMGALGAHLRNAPRRWGVGVEGSCDGVAVTIAECETSLKHDPWSVLVVWPVGGAVEPVVVVPGTSPLHLEGAPAARAAFLTEARQQALEAWPHGGVLVREGGWAAWETRGLLTPERLEELLARFPEVRRLCE